MKEVASLRVRTHDGKRLFDGLTHPSRLGTSKLTFRKERWTFPPAVFLLMSLLTDEYQSKVRLPDVDMSAWIEERDEPPTMVRQRLPLLIDDVEVPVETLRTLTMEFELGFVERGETVIAVFHGLTVC